MPWSPSDAPKHTGLANTASRRKLWARTANEIYANGGDEAKAIRIANTAVHRSIERSVHAKIRKLNERREDMTRFI